MALKGKLISGKINFVSVGQLLPYVMYATPVLNEYLSELVGYRNVFHITANVFAIVCANDDDAFRYRTTILKRFESPWQLESINTRIQVNTGMIRFPEDVGNINDFFGVNTYLKQMIRQDPLHNYIEMTPELSKRYNRTTEVNAALKRAIKNNSLQVYFQPIFDSSRQQFTALEALARMIDEELGFVAPDEFIDAAETNGMIIPLDMMILDKTCEFIEKELLTKPGRHHIQTVQVNISALQCMQQNMDQMILSIIDKHHVPHEMIMLEITEHATVYATELMEMHMRNLKEQGVCFALDDYGTGNSNCSYLIDYPFDKVKFDKSMVWAYFKSETAKVILDGEMQTIHKLEIPIVAEGIEDEDQLEGMNALGVEYIQGYYYSKPLPCDELLEFILEKE